MITLRADALVAFNSFSKNCFPTRGAFHPKPFGNSFLCLRNSLNVIPSARWCLFSHEGSPQGSIPRSARQEHTALGGQGKYQSAPSATKVLSSSNRACSLRSLRRARHHPEPPTSLGRTANLSNISCTVLGTKDTRCGDKYVIPRIATCRSCLWGDAPVCFDSN